MRTHNVEPDPDELWGRLSTLATSWPSTTATTSYGAPSLKVNGRLFARIRGEVDDAFVFACTPEERHARLDSAEPGLFTEPHYEKYGHILADATRTDPVILEDLLDLAWALTANERTRRKRDEGSI